MSGGGPGAVLASWLSLLATSGFAFVSFFCGFVKVRIMSIGPEKIFAGVDNHKRFIARTYHVHVSAIHCSLLVFILTELCRR